MNLTGFEFGPPPLNPYEVFKTLKPVDVIDSSVFVYDRVHDGHFELPLAAALAKAQKADVFLAAKKLPEALEAAQQAVSLAPSSVYANETMGRVLDELGRRQEARPYYATALKEALTVQPDFQSSEVRPLKERLAAQ